MDTPLTTREIRNIYKIESNINRLETVQYEDYIQWLEKHLAQSNFNTIEKLGNIIQFNETCLLCEKLSYSSKHQVCSNPNCFNYILKDPMDA